MPRSPLRSADAIVIGCGGMGAAACCALAARGVRTIGLERLRRGHDRGSSHGHSRVVRQAYFEHADYVPLLKRSFELFTRLEELSGRRLLARIGAAFIGRPDATVIAGSLASARMHGIPHELLDAREAMRRWPPLSVAETHAVLFEPGAGFVRPEATTLAHLEVAESLGALVVEDATVRGWKAEGTGFVVRTEHDEYRASRLVLCAGPWMAGLAPGLPTLRVTRQPIVWVDQRAEQRAAHAADRLPVWLVERDDGTAAYGIPAHPILDGPRGMKVAIHGGGIDADPDRVDRTASAAEIEAAVSGTRAILPDGAAEIVASSVCLYTYSPDGHFIVDRWPDDERVVVACGFSGHGFKFAPVIGEILADLVQGPAPPEASFLSLSRRSAPR
jgi:sarcosine oxidase